MVYEIRAYKKLEQNEIDELAKMIANAPSLKKYGFELQDHSLVTHYFPFEEKLVITLADCRGHKTLPMQFNFLELDDIVDIIKRFGIKRIELGK